MALIEIVLTCLDDNTLNKIKRKCEAYTTYTIDNKQLNKKNEIKTRQKEFLELLELVNAQLVYNQFELSTKNIGENVKSTLNESKDVEESKKEKNK